MKKLKKIMAFILTKVVYKVQCGKKTYIISPLQLDNAKNIYCGCGVHIYDGAWLMAGKDNTTLIIEDGVQIGHYSHIIALNKVVIKKNVLIADKVFISDTTHNYEDVSIPVMNQEIKSIKEISIGEGSWLGENVCVCGSNIGTHCVIGANSVVTEDIPDYSVAVGIPAKVVKKYNFEKKQWERW